MEKFVLSEMNRINFSEAANKIYLLTDYNHKQYPDYWKWYYNKNIPRVINGTGDIIFYLDGFVIVGLSILKKDVDEAKICTLLINEPYRKKGFSKMILENSFDVLGTDKPLITIPEYRLDEFSGIIQSYDWKKTDISSDYFSPEIIFNGTKSNCKIKHR